MTQHSIQACNSSAPVFEKEKEMTAQLSDIHGMVPDGGGGLSYIDTICVSSE